MSATVCDPVETGMVSVKFNVNSSPPALVCAVAKWGLAVMMSAESSVGSKK